MTQRIAYLEAVVGADITNFRRSMREVRSEVGFLSDTVQGLGHLGRNMTLAVTAPLVAMGTAAVQVATDFDASMRNINSILGASESALADLSARTLEFGATIREGPIAASEALYTVISAGVLDSATAFSIMEASVATAEAGAADLQTTTQALVSTMLAYSAGAEEAGHYSDVLTRTVQVGVGPMNLFATAIGRNVATANAAGVSFDEFGAALAYLTQRGIRADTASTALNSALRSLLNPGEDLAALFTELGVGSGTELIQTFGGLEGAVLALNEAAGGNVDAISAMFTTQGSRAIQTILNDVEGFSASMDEFGEAVDGATGRAREEQLKSFAAQLDLMNSALMALGVEVGTTLLPILTPFVQGLTQVFTAIRELPPEVVQLGVGFALAAAAAGPLLWIFASMISPLGLLVGAVAAVAAAFANDFAGIRTLVEDVASAVSASLEVVDDNILKDLQPTLENIQGIIGGSQPVQSIDIPLSANMTLNQVYYEDSEIGRQLRSMFDYDEFLQTSLEQLGVSDPRLIQQGSSLHFDMPISMGFDLIVDTSATPGSSLSPSQLADLLMPAEQPDLGFGEKLTRAIDAGWGVLQPRLQQLGTDIVNELINNVFPGLDTLGGDILTRIGNAFAGTVNTGGNTPFYKTLQMVIRGDFEAAINSVIPGLGTSLGTALESAFPTGISGAFPKIIAAFGTMMSNIGQWIINEGIPTLSRSIGYLVGTIGVEIGRFVDRIPSMLSGVGEGGGIGSAIVDSVTTPMAQGFQDAINASGEELNLGDTIATAIAGAIGLALAANLATALITQGVGATIMGAIGASVTASTAAGAAGSALAAALGGALVGALSAVLVVGYIMNPEMRSQINDIGEAIADAMFGEGWTAQARTDIEDGIRGVVEPIARLVGSEMRSNELGTQLADGIINRAEYERQMNALMVEMGGVPIFAEQPQEIIIQPDLVFASLDSEALSAIDMTPIFDGLNSVDFSQFGTPPAPIDLSDPFATATPPLPLDATQMATDTAALFSGELPGAISTSMAEQDFSEPVAMIVSGIATPIQTTFTSVFGEGGSLHGLWTTFTGIFNTGVTDMIATGAEGERQIPAQFQRMATTSLPKIQSVIAKMVELAGAIRTVMSLGASINITAQVAGPSGARAGGGPTFGGNPYLVGEQGPEIFVPNVSGSVLPNSVFRQDGGSGQTYQNNEFNFYEVADLDAFLAEADRRGIALR